MSKTYLDSIVRKETPPLFRFKGSSFEAGAAMARWTLDKYPFYPTYLNQAVHFWTSPPPHILDLFRKYAPWTIDLYNGMLSELEHLNFDAEAPNPEIPIRKPDEACTSFSLQDELCAGNSPISGQTKDTGIVSLDLYIVSNLQLEDGPSILVLAYPGELLGYGFWSNGMSIFRNNLRSSAESQAGLPFFIYGLLAMATGTVEKAAELAMEERISGAGHLMFSDLHNAISVEYNAGGVSIIPRGKDGILVHANHPVGAETSRFTSRDAAYIQASESRGATLEEALKTTRHPFDIDGLHTALSSHMTPDNFGVCRHGNIEGTMACTTATVVAKPLEGRLFATKGPACLNPFTEYTIG